MGQLTGAIIANETVGLYAAIDSTDAALVQAVTKVKPKYTFSVAVAIAAGGALEAPVGIAEANMAITSFKYLPGATLTADNTSYATFTLEQATAAGTITSMGATTTKTTASSGTGDWTKAVPVSLTVTAASSVVPSGSSLLVKVAQTAGGVAIPQGTFVIDGVYT